jgi:predicted HTH transcriptional regulator
LGENLGKDEDLTNEYKNYHHLDKLNKNDKAFPILQKTICSFLNTKGGRIYIGIDDNFEVIGYNIS